MIIPFSDYLVMAWFLANLITGMGYLWVSYEIHTWTCDLPPSGIGFRILARMFEIFIVASGIHHLVVCTLIWYHPTPLYMVITDMVVAVSSLVTALSLNRARGLLKAAFQTMLRHGPEWVDPDL